MKWSVESMKVRKEDWNGWKLEVKFRRAVQGHGVRVQCMWIRGQRSKVRRRYPDGCQKTGGGRKGRSDLIKGRGQRLEIRKAS